MGSHDRIQRHRIDPAPRTSRRFCPPFGTVRLPYGFPVKRKTRRGDKQTWPLTDRDRTE
jgi:hypothetical protein